MFFVIDVGTDNGDYDHQQGDGHEDEEEYLLGEERRENDGDTAAEPELACNSVSIVPVVFVVECPRDFDAETVVLLAFGHIISDNSKQKTEENGKQNIDIKTVAQCKRKNNTAYQN